MVIARRDYVATVRSRAFLLFLIGPLLLAAMVIFLTSRSAAGNDEARRSIALIADAAVARSFEAAGVRLGHVVGHAVPEIRAYRPARDISAQKRQLLRRDGVILVVSGLPDAPVLTGRSDMIDRYDGLVALLNDEARAATILRQRNIDLRAGPMTRDAIDHVPAADRRDRNMTGQFISLMIFALTMIFSGMLLSNMVEEKSNKVMEVLAAAAPIDAIFLGKLVAMLGISLSSIAVWGLSACVSRLLFAPDLLANFASPTVGWPAMMVLATGYFVTNFLLVGALYLGIGAHASTMRQVQFLSMPLAIAQFGVFGFASAAIAEGDGNLAIASAIFPWSSTLTMSARAALMPDIGMHIVALAWQILWIFVIINISARIFRRNILESGSGNLRFL